MSDVNLENTIENAWKEETAQSEAVKSLIKVKPRDRKTGLSDVELKTDLDERQILIHTKAELIAQVLSLKSKDFNASNIVGNIIEKLERKNISKNRAGRREVVDVARNPDVNMTDTEAKAGGVRRLFMRRPK